VVIDETRIPAEADARRGISELFISGEKLKLNIAAPEYSRLPPSAQKVTAGISFWGMATFVKLNEEYNVNLYGQLIYINIGQSSKVK